MPEFENIQAQARFPQLDKCKKSFGKWFRPPRSRQRTMEYMASKRRERGKRFKNLTGQVSHFSQQVLAKRNSYRELRHLRLHHTLGHTDATSYLAASTSYAFDVI